mgnify:CR=1 FL=1
MKSRRADDADPSFRCRAQRFLDFSIETSIRMVGELRTAARFLRVFTAAAGCEELKVKFSFKNDSPRKHGRSGI